MPPLFWKQTCAATFLALVHEKVARMGRIKLARHLQGAVPHEEWGVVSLEVPDSGSISSIEIKMYAVDPPFGIR